MTTTSPPHGLGLAQPIAGLNHIISYGQSLSSGWEGWPALSISPRGDSLMLGRSIRPASESAPHWTPVGEATLQPLAATVQGNPGGQLLTREEIARLPPGSVALGETPLEAAVHGYREAMLATLGETAAPVRLLASACGVGGRALESLSRGAPIELFNRLRDCTRLARQTAASIRLPYQVLALLMLHGETNAWALNGGTADRSAYRTLLARFYGDAVAYLAQGAAGQTAPPAMFLYQTSGAYCSDELGVAMAQLDIANGLPGCFLAAPVYPVTGKGGHLDANGYRWLGSQFAKVMHRVLTAGESWQPLQPRYALLLRDRAVLRFEVPAPPLAWGRPFAGHRRIDVADHGFTLADAGGPVPLAAVEITGADTVTLTLARAASGPATVRYADRRHGGRGSLHDSDATTAPDCYEYDPLTGHPATADQPDLTGRPYPLMNWCVAFNVPVQPG